MGTAWVARHGLTGAQYQAEFDNNSYQGYRLTCVSGYADQVPHYAAIWRGEGMSGKDIGLIDSKIQAYLAKNLVPGISVAIARNERLVFAKGYGNADVQTGEKVSPPSLFRIASISKPVTAVAVMELVEAGKLKLDQKVFGAGAILGTQYGTQPYSERVRAITVQQLLQHTSGWSNEGGDPMFLNPGMSQAQLIGWVLDTREPKNVPGDKYEYLNFGYCVLGRIIEKVSGQKYETYVQNAVLANCGISRMQIGGDTQAAKKPGEVVYYGGSPYNLNPGRMDAHGGWIASSIDLLRFMVRTDGFPAKADILFPVSETTMFSGSTDNPGYGMGWIVNNEYRGHNGAMPGTIGFLVRRADGFSFAVLVNTRPADDLYCFELKKAVDAIVTSPINWPGYDLS